jgi:hypothetical protein
MPRRCALLWGLLLALQPLLLALLPEGVLQQIELLLLHPRHSPDLWRRGTA